VNNVTGQVCDNINTKGTRSWWSFTYNNGLMLADAVHLYHATGNTIYLDDASLFASYLMIGQAVTVNGTKVTILADDSNGGCDADSSQFHQVGFQYLTEYYSLLLQLNQTDAACDLYTFLQNNIDSLWLNARNSNTGTFNCNWDIPFDKGTEGIQGSENTALSALSLFAALPVPTVQLADSKTVLSIV